MPQTDSPVVLLSGASGFIGRHILQSLTDSGKKVLALHRERYGSEQAGVTWRRVDLHDAMAVKAVLSEFRPAICIHAAWSMEASDFWTSADNLKWAGLSLRLAKLFVESGGRQFVGVGSQAEYVNTSERCSEAMTTTPGATLYGVTKDCVRRIIQSYCESCDVSFAWARVFNVFGEGEQSYKLIPSVIRSLAAGGHARLSSGSAVRDFIDVRDVGSAVVALASSALEGAVNVASGQGCSVADVARRIGELMNAADKIQLGALPDRVSEAPSMVADISRLRDQLNFRPRYSLDAGLLDAIALV